MIQATCATLAAVLASAQPGATVSLTGTCERVEVARNFARPTTIDASRAHVKGLALSGRNIVWRGGTLSAPLGFAGKATDGYAVRVTGRGVVVEKTTITDARMGMVIFEAADVAVRNNRFWRLRSDGINASRTTGLKIVGNSFDEFLPWPKDHPDAIQLRDGVVDAAIENNEVYGDAQGIGQMDTKGDRPLERVAIRWNKVRVTLYHTITLTECLECLIENNDFSRGRPDRKAVIRAGRATRCGNSATDDKREPRCRK